MPTNTIIYSKQSGEPRIPVTARIEWLPDGTIKPCMYWTPDGSCYQVKQVYEMTPLAVLKDRGEGIRFKIRAEMTETPEPCADHQFARLETYLYLADDRFCGRNIIDDRYGHEGKEFISVTLDAFPNSEYELVYFNVQGTRYLVEKTIAVEPRGSFNAGGAGVWHKVEARQVNIDDDENPDPQISVRRMAALYFEINKWFVAVNSA